MVKLFPLSCILSLTLIAMQPHAMSGQHMRNKELKRTQFTAFQLHKLEETFIHSQYISTGMRQLLSQELGLSDGSIKVKHEFLT